ncbi:gamma-tubulin complex component 4 homolog [Bradysia coprophila]|uniref:gamma-tubulin complex component 4 homolog n=1 Tax=Bradysia coprophila TaxID=38358 RepID=UPI00187D9158|nr:gamma-tubulin complex component 4 homolog [Bradysia coprophila]
MIHDLIVSLLHLNENKSLKTFLISNASHDFLHPSEHKILERIVRIADNQIEIAKFVGEHSGKITSNTTVAQDDVLQKGIYLQALSVGMNLCMTPYRNAMVELEQRFLNIPTYSLMFLLTELSRFEDLLEFLLQFIAGIRTERLHGCALLQYLHNNSLHGNKQIAEAVEIIQRSVHSVFIKQLSKWVIYGELDDKYGEFFIQHIDQRNTTDHQTNSGQTTTTLSDATRSVHTDLWRYEIWYEMLPNYLTPTWAGEVLFLGQTVVMFNMDRREIEKHAKMVRDDETDDPMEPIDSLWGDQDFAQQFQDLHADSGANMLKLVELVEQIKIYVSEKLTKIALKQVDLIKQLKLIKDFFMLGRGELFLEFVKKTQSIQSVELDEHTARTVTKAFENAANSVNVTEDLENFTLSVPLGDAETTSLDIRGIFRHILLRYNVQWPLHLLFSPKVMERYNELFRFLLQIRRVQYDLQTVWCYHREKKMKKGSPMLQFRNQLMFLVDNLQYYLQVDVLESQFSILMDTVQKSKDFEHIQRAHTIFQANVMSLCFLLHEIDTTKSMHQSIMLQTNENPVFVILNQLIDNVCLFCELSLKCSDPLKKSEMASFTNYEFMVNENVKDLMKLLMGWKAGANNAPLNQLLLRLDYNHYYSSQFGDSIE